MIPMDDRDGFMWFDGKMVPWRDAKIHVLTHGLHYASAVFEGMRAYGGAVFELTRHNERLHNSAALLGFSVPFTVAELDKACKDVVAANGALDAYVRPIAWRGSEQMGVSAQQSTIHVAISRPNCARRGSSSPYRNGAARPPTRRPRHPRPPGSI